MMSRWQKKLIGRSAADMVPCTNVVYFASINKVVVYSPQSIPMKWEEVRLFCNTLLDFNTEIVVALSGDISSQWTDRDIFIMRLVFYFKRSPSYLLYDTYP